MYEIRSNADSDVWETLEGIYWAQGKETNITFYENLQHFQRE